MVKAAINNLPKDENSGLNGLSAKFYQTFKEFKPSFLKLYHEILREGT
jgi:hypothetical protein